MKRPPPIHNHTRVGYRPSMTTTAEHDGHRPPGDPSYDGFRITTLFVFTAVDPDDDQEAVVPDPASGLPLIGADATRMMDLLPAARRFAEQTKLPVTLRAYTLASSRVI